MKRSNSIKQNFGFTLIELLVTLTIFAILIGVATPAMRDFSRNQVINGAVTNLSSDIQYARSEAVARKTQVAICASTDGASCASTDDWLGGWIVLITDADKCPAAGECVLRTKNGLSAAMTLNASVNTAINFSEQGTTNATVQFALCSADRAAAADDIYLRTLTLKPSGSRQIRVGASSCDP